VDLATGRASTLVDGAGVAALVRDGARLVVVTEPLDGHGLRAVGLDGQGVTIQAADRRGRLAGRTPELGVELPPDWFVVLGADGPLARRLDSSSTRRFDEVRP
jgi:hypothetical protein